MKALYIYISLSILIYLFVACNNPSKGVVICDQVLHYYPREITVVLENPKRIVSDLVPRISFFNGYYYNRIFIETTNTYNSTYSTYKKENIVNYLHSDGYIYSYLIEEGDTLKIEIVDGIPFAISSNKKLSNMELNINASFVKAKLKDTEYENYLTPISFITNGKTYNEDILLSNHYKILENKEKYIDSLIIKHSLSEEILYNLTVMDKLGDIYTRSRLRIKGYDNDILLGTFLNDDYLNNDEYNTLITLYTNIKHISKNNPIQMFDKIISDPLLLTRRAYIYNFIKPHMRYSYV